MTSHDEALVVERDQFGKPVGVGRGADEVRHFTDCTYDDGDGTGAAYVSRVTTARSGTKVVIRQAAARCIRTASCPVPIPAR